MCLLISFFLSSFFPSCFPCRRHGWSFKVRRQKTYFWVRWRFWTCSIVWKVPAHSVLLLSFLGLYSHKSVFCARLCIWYTWVPLRHAKCHVCCKEMLWRLHVLCVWRTFSKYRLRGETLFNCSWGLLHCPSKNWRWEQVTSLSFFITHNKLYSKIYSLYY